MGEMVGIDPDRTQTELAPEVDALLRRAAAHPLGQDFIARGSPDAVSATFRVHAFVVDAARDMLVTQEAVPAIVEVPAARVPTRA